jgi:hypothetical protein
VTVVLSADRSLAPGDIRALGAGDLVTLRRSVKDRADWDHIIPALLIAVVRGASVVWED